MSRHARFALSILLSSAVTPVWLRGQSPVWDSVAAILKSPAAATGGYMRFNFPRRDVTMTVGDVTLAPALALGMYAGFAGSGSKVNVMGDLILLPSELKPVLAELAKQKFAVTAVHNHLMGETPHMAYVHFHAMGGAVELARQVDRVLQLTGAPRPVAPSTQPVTADTATVYRVLGQSGRASGNVVQVSFMLVNVPVTMHGDTVQASLGYASPINLQFVSPTRLVGTGDFSVLGDRVDGVTRVLALNGITTTAVHSHLAGETPSIRYVHFWADGAPADVLKGLRAALDVSR